MKTLKQIIKQTLAYLKKTISRTKQILKKVKQALAEKGLSQANRSIIKTQVGLDTPGNTVFDARIEKMDEYSEELTRRYSPTNYINDDSKAKTEEIIQSSIAYADNTGEFNQRAGNLIGVARNAEIEGDQIGDYRISGKDAMKLMGTDWNPASFTPLEKKIDSQSFDEAIEAYRRLREKDEEITFEEVYKQLTPKQQEALENAASNNFNQMLKEMNAINRPEHAWNPSDYIPEMIGGASGVYDYNAYVQASESIELHQELIDKIVSKQQEEEGVRAQFEADGLSGKELQEKIKFDKDEKIQKFSSELINPSTNLDDILQRYQDLSDDEKEQLREAAEEARQIREDTMPDDTSEAYKELGRAYVDGNKFEEYENFTVAAKKTAEKKEEYLKQLRQLQDGA